MYIAHIHFGLESLRQMHEPYSKNLNSAKKTSKIFSKLRLLECLNIFFNGILSINVNHQMAI